MKLKLYTLTLLIGTMAISCQKPLPMDAPETITKPISEITVPQGFTWENSRNVSFTVNINDATFQGGALHLITIYDGDPANGGNLLAKGSATTIAAFKTKVYVSNQITQVYIVRTAPNNTSVTQKIEISKDAVITLL